MKLRIAWLTVLLALTSACGGSGSSSTNSSNGALSGNWQMSLLKKGTTKFPKTLSGSLVQTGDVITGSLIFTDTPCSGVGSVSGSVSGSNVAMLVSPTGVTVNLTGTMQSNQMMGGDFNVLSNGCAGSGAAPLTGTWMAQPVMPLSGNFTGTFTSNKVGALQVTGKLSQGPNAGISSISLTGDLTVTDYCFAGANIVGSVSGTSVVMNLVNSAGAEIGQITSTTSTLDGTTSVSGPYHVIPEGTGGQAPCADGDSGTVSLTL